MSGGRASGSWTATPTTEPIRPCERARAWARGTPRTVTSTSDMVEPSTDTPSAPHSPGVSKPRWWDPASRKRNATIGKAR